MLNVKWHKMNAYLYEFEYIISNSFWSKLFKLTTEITNVCFLHIGFWLLGLAWHGMTWHGFTRLLIVMRDTFCNDHDIRFFEWTQDNFCEWWWCWCICVFRYVNIFRLFSSESGLDKCWMLHCLQSMCNWFYGIWYSVSPSTSTSSSTFGCTQFNVFYEHL